MIELIQAIRERACSCVLSSQHMAQAICDDDTCAGCRTEARARLADYRNGACVLATAIFALTPHEQLRAEAVQAALLCANMLAELPGGHGREAN